MAKHTHRIPQQQPTNCLSVFDYFVSLVLKGFISVQYQAFSLEFQSNKRILLSKISITYYLCVIAKMLNNILVPAIFVSKPIRTDRFTTLQDIIFQELNCLYRDLHKDIPIAKNASEKNFCLLDAQNFSDLFNFPTIELTNIIN